ncbi:NAD(P)/FAD-dependent oxidoreductase [Nonlabens ponticola]|uniref:NAD(P)/FAD-dependent oxidoreductase n=1 Tax=Nonlabens ponticola TaxID=2496866 RepID=A0A3S9MZ84_9FLAO|nr:NAD(P)/FAD-dependent oxidoreductase [Nonlabens ponticola]AZQ44373.1 NAD(P)/FAD-dependent oxidoreductase [Nonlabens ponticola]
MVNSYDIIIAGGGLSGLCAAIELSQEYQVLLIDPHEYPRHKMCGEYLSAEIYDVLASYGVNLKTLTSAHIQKFKVSTTNGDLIQNDLPLGGYGVSRYCLDHELFKIASKKATIITAKVLNAKSTDDCHEITTDRESFSCRQFIIATGKRSILDKALDRDFAFKKNEWLAVKMHYQYDMSWNEVQLHNFNGGYAGLSRVESGAVNLCYLTTFKSFQQFKEIEQFNKHVLSANPHLKAFFENAIPLWDKPISISQISFDKRGKTKSDFLFIGDAAGLIHPLCGNGMAMAIHSAHIASKLVKKYMDNTISRKTMLAEYQKSWKKNFGNRMRYGRWIQSILINPQLTRIMYNALKLVPSSLKLIIRKTHGKPVSA